MAKGIHPIFLCTIPVSDCAVKMPEFAPFCAASRGRNFLIPNSVLNLFGYDSRTLHGFARFRVCHDDVPPF